MHYPTNVVATGLFVRIDITYKRIGCFSRHSSPFSLTASVWGDTDSALVVCSPRRPLLFSVFCLLHPKDKWRAEHSERGKSHNCMHISQCICSYILLRSHCMAWPAFRCRCAVPPLFKVKLRLHDRWGRISLTWQGRPPVNIAASSLPPTKWATLQDDDAFAFFSRGGTVASWGRPAVAGVDGKSPKKSNDT